jgi:hypothetical protein
MKTTIIIFLSLLISVSSFAQRPGNRMEIEKRYRSQKIAFITDKMQLSSEEAQVFWPVFREFEAEKDKLAMKIREYRNAFPKDEADMTEEQAIKFLTHLNDHSLAMSELGLEYQKKFLKVISAKQLLLLRVAENGFRRHLLREFKGKGGNRRKN